MLCCWIYPPPKRLAFRWSAKKYPYILIKGRWFRDYGFTIGDQVTITNPRPGTLIMSVTKTAKEMQAIRDQQHEDMKALVSEQRLKAA